MLAKGIGAEVEIVENRVKISRTGISSFVMHGLKGDKEILISQISSIQFKNASIWTNGYIQFGFLGGREAKGGLLQGTKDENTVLFKKKHQRDFEALRARIYEMQNDEKDQPSSPPGQSPLDELNKLASLLDRGVINNEEFESQKRRILDAT